MVFTICETNVTIHKLTLFVLDVIAQNYARRNWAPHGLSEIWKDVYRSTLWQTAHFVSGAAIIFGLTKRFLGLSNHIGLLSYGVNRM